MTFQQALIHATKVMTQAGVTTPQVDARRLLCAATGISPDRLTLHMPDPLGPTEVDVFESHVAKRCNGVPVSHLVGGRQFYGRWFKVTPDVLDPRPETETLVVAAITEPFQKALDLGVGSGALLVTLMLEQEKAAGTGVDLSATAIEIAAQNAVGLGVQQRTKLLVSDWFDAVEGTFDLIVSNPPYIAAAEMDELQPEVRLHEPRIALTDEADGLTHYRHIIAHHDPYLTPGGRLMVEIGPTQAQAVMAMMQAVNLADITVIPDLDGRDRVVWGRKPLKTA